MLWFSSSSPIWHRLQCLASDIFFVVLFTCPNHLSLACLYLSVIFSTFSVWCLISHMVSQYVAATHLHPRHFQFLHVWVSHRQNGHRRHCTEHNTTLLYYLYINFVSGSLTLWMVCQGLSSIKILSCYLHDQVNYGNFLHWKVFGILIIVNYWCPN